jgi:hypothetical protein
LLEVWKDENSNAKFSDSESELEKQVTTKKPVSMGKLRLPIPRPKPSTCEEDGNKSVEEVIVLDEDYSEDSDDNRQGFVQLTKTDAQPSTGGQPNLKLIHRRG